MAREAERGDLVGPERSGSGTPVPPPPPSDPSRGQRFLATPPVHPPRWGIAGAGAAASLSCGLDLLTVTVPWARRQGVPVRDLVPRRADARAVADISFRQARELAWRALRLGRLARWPPDGSHAPAR